jgi:asparagine synthase (glutamine-hydrolysing)
MFNETGRIAVVFNGEIYNFQDLTAELVRRDHHFATRSDTEAIVHAWEEWGDDCLHRFNGMFAFALWDEDRQTLFLARDRLGEKPLYWTMQSGFLLFASELSALLRGLDTTPGIDPYAVEEYFAFGYVPDPRTIWRGVYKLPPGSKLLIRRGSEARTALAAAGAGAARRWWEPRFVPAADARPSRPEDAEILRDLLQQAVRLRLVSDVPLGAFLSGGLDSSGVVALMAACTGGNRVKTCSMGFNERHFDESPWAARMARHVGADHYVESVDPHACGLTQEGLEGIVAHLAATYSEPFADSSAVPTWLLCRLARRRVTVALSGDGADEVFAGYRRYPMYHREEAVKRYVPPSMRRLLFGPLAALYPQLDRAPRWFRAKATFMSLTGDDIDGHFRSVAITPTPERHALLSQELRSELGGYDASEVLRAHAARAAAGLDRVSQMQQIDLQTWLPGMMLVKVDRASMAHGLEVRLPFLDPNVVEWAAGSALSDKLARTAGKVALKRALAPLLPAGLPERRKQGFSIPLAAWLRGPMRRQVEGLSASRPLRDSAAIDPEAVRQLARDHLSGRRDHSRTLWSVIMFEAFLKLPAINGRSAAVREAATA